MKLIIECPSCRADIPARRAPLVKVTCHGCGSQLRVNMEREQ